MDKKEKWIDIDIDRENNRVIGYNYDLLDDPTSDRLFDKCMRESWILEEAKIKLEVIENDIQLIWLLYTI